jgi:hypothetical protein
VLYSVNQQPDLAGGCLTSGITAHPLLAHSAAACGATLPTSSALRPPVAVLCASCGSLFVTFGDSVPLLEESGIEGFIRREIWPYVPDAWVDGCKTQIGYEISFTRHFYKPQPLRTLDEIRADILAPEQETEGLLGKFWASESLGAASPPANSCGESMIRSAKSFRRNSCQLIHHLTWRFCVDVSF